MEPAGFWRRFFAECLDWIIVNLGCLCFALVYDIPTPHHDFVQVIMGLICLGVMVLYYPLFESSSAQSTLGQRLLKIRVFSLSHERVTFGRAFLRFVAGGFSMLILVCAVLLCVGILIFCKPEGYVGVLIICAGGLGSIFWYLCMYYLRVFSKRTQTFRDYASNTLMLVPVPVLHASKSGHCPDLGNNT